ncbi:MAG TPA: glycosyltransferase family 2 protein [Candidatus Limiplasma sp.]|nr:glycosyltransferase family 2 protein [Candidatus Limiplasma sp.]HPS80977.1 glycosyltransferase family 2 protein [Candidatus Limiplasma sp.]
MNDRISVVVPVYNKRAYLAQCVASVAGQGYAPCEVILVDDGSTDGSAGLCDTLAAENARVRVLHQSNAGVSAARNAGAMAATGEWITFLDADDQLLPGSLLLFAGATDPAVDGVCGGILQGAEKAGPARPNRRWISETERYAACVAMVNDPTRYLTSHAWLLRADWLRQHSLLFCEELRYGEDGEWMLRCLMAMRGLVMLGAPVYRYSVAEDSALHQYRAGMVDQYLRTLDTVKREQAENGWAVPLGPYYLTHLLLMLTHGVFHPGNRQPLAAAFGEARRLCGRAVFREALAGADLSAMGFGRRAALRSLAHGWIFPAWVAIRLRQRRNRRLSRA